jgi:hypothetical protein
MSKVSIPEDLKGKELFAFLKANKQSLIAEKKSMLKHTEAFISTPSVGRMKVTKDGSIVKVTTAEDGDSNEAGADADTMIPDAESVHVTVVANAANWCDSQMDVLIPDCWKASIKARKGMIPHLHDHIHQIEAKIGEVDKIYSKDMKLADLGLKQEGSTQVLIFETDVMKSYNEKVYNQYKLGKINQHSIGLQYVKISLCINDEESEKEFDFWNKYIDQVINRDVVEARGYFWVVSEIKLLENSCVLFGANELTPTLDVKVDTHSEPSSDTNKDEPPPFDLLGHLKSMVMCPTCVQSFSAPASGPVSCPNCGQFVSPNSNSAETGTFDLLQAITETKFI